MNNEKVNSVLRISKRNGGYTTEQLNAMHEHRKKGGLISEKTDNIDYKPDIAYFQLPEKKGFFD